MQENETLQTVRAHDPTVEAELVNMRSTEETSASLERVTHVGREAFLGSVASSCSAASIAFISSLLLANFPDLDWKLLVELEPSVQRLQRCPNLHLRDFASEGGHRRTLALKECVQTAPLPNIRASAGM